MSRERYVHNKRFAYVHSVLRILIPATVNCIFRGWIVGSSNVKCWLSFQCQRIRKKCTVSAILRQLIACVFANFAFLQMIERHRSL